MKSEINQNEIEIIEAAMQDYSHEGWNWSDDSGKVIWTTETTDDFKKNGKWADIYRNEIETPEVTADEIIKWQSTKGDQRQDLLVFDFGDHRIVLAY